MKITIGKPIANTQIYIVDSFLQPVPIGITGELCIAGDGVGAGYLNRPELTAERFIDNPFGKGKLYKTGDLAYWREDGNIVYVGRNDFQVKIRGLRIELGEIENAISSIDGITQAVVIVRKNNEGRQLICAFYTGREIDAKGIRSQIGGRLPKYMLPHIITHIDEMPLTPSGKINRKALPEIDLGNIDSGVEYVAPETDREKTLVRAISEVLDIETVGVLDNFFDLGGDSLKAIELTSVLEDAGYTVAIKTIFDSTDIRTLAEKITVKKGDEAHREYGSVIPATPAQMRVYTSQSMNTDSTLYNVPYVFRAQSVDVARLQTAVDLLIARHESLRTHFENQNGQIMQVIDAAASVQVEVLSSDNISDFIRPFDLSVSPLLRVGVFEKTLMFDLHHIIADGGSMPVFFRELNELYMGREMKSDPVQYGEFAVTPVDNEEDERYWLSVFNDELPVLEMNTDIPRSDKQSYAGAAEYGVIPGELHNKIKEKCKSLKITPYVFYMAAFSILLSKFSNNEDIVIGMPVSGRSPKYLNTVGMFVNTLALRTKPDGEKSVEDFLREVKEISVAAIDHQNYPFRDLVKKIHAETAGRNPLFDVMFAYQSEEMTDVVFADSQVELKQIPVTASKCDMTFNILPRKEDVILMVEYCTDLYKATSIKRFLESFRLVLFRMTEKTKIKNLTALSSVENEQVCFAFNGNTKKRQEKCIHRLFEEEVQKIPETVAIVAYDKTLTYRELNDEANRIAHGLLEKGCKKGDVVAFTLFRNSHLIPVIFGILKAGCAYLPLDKNWPEDRIDFIVRDCNARLVINEENLNELLKNRCVDNLVVAVSPFDLCYCIYTSGTTGHPKGVMIRHSNLFNFCVDNTPAAIIKDGNTLLSVFNPVFDAFGLDYALCLLNGKSVILAPDDDIHDAKALSELCVKYNVDIIHSTPSLTELYLEEESYRKMLNQVKVIILGAEIFSVSLLRKLSDCTKAVIYNGYGPSETTIGVTYAKLPRMETAKQSIKELSVISKEKEDQILFGFNDTKKAYQPEKSVFEYFAEQVKDNPNATAVAFHSEYLSFAELNNRISDCCSKLQMIGIQKKDVVAVHLNRGVDLIVFQLAVLKAGAVFLPVDKRYPLNRILLMYKDCKCAVLISDTLQSLKDYNILALNRFNAINVVDSSVSVRNENACYIIYTSGSTGQPKGCMLTNRGLVNFCKNNNTLETLLKRKNNVFACVNSVSFDYFIAESLFPLLNGFATVIFDENESTDREAFLSAIEKYNINVLMTTPTRLKLFYGFSTKKTALYKLDCICSSGEPLSQELLLSIRKQSPQAKIYNPLGPSECSVWDIGGGLDSDVETDIHIGKPIANTQVYIVNKYMQIVPIGVTGELCIAGDGVGVGYLNRPELTAERFIDNPFGKGKLYKTGDLAYWREDGNIVYVGRNDFQVKIRGLRIELGEIENEISSVSGVTQAVVIVRKDDHGRQLICAFYTGKELEAKEIRSIIGEKLPKYMLPHIITHIDEMPLTPSGKINRKALPEVDLNHIDNATEYVAPVTEREKTIAKILAEILEVERVGLEDDFFELGCDSLKAIEFISACHYEGIYFNLQSVFDHPTISALLQAVDNADHDLTQYDAADFEAINKLTAENTVDHIPSPRETPVGNLLLAGATGYLGAHILADFLEHDTGSAYCVVRGNDVEDSKRRLHEYLLFYFDGKYIGSDRIEVICGDLSKEQFGLSATAYESLAEKVDTIINAAASVKHYGSYEYFYETNVKSVFNIIDFCRKSKAKLIHISTTSVAGNDFDNQMSFTDKADETIFTEHNLYIGQPLDNVYVRSKFEAEKTVLDAMSEGLRANIMRMGNLTNRRSDGKFQKNHESNAFLNRLKAIVDLGMIPRYLLDLHTEFTPIDEAAQAVMAITRHFRKDKNIFHIENTNLISFSEMFHYMSILGLNMKIADEEDFGNCLRETENNPETKYIYETFINDLGKDNRLNYESPIKIDTAFSNAYLRSLGFVWHETDLDYLNKYFAYFRQIGYMGSNEDEE